MVTGLALLAYVASMTGYPLPMPTVAQDASTPYPCQGHACGCNSAAQCWDSCCCYSAAERLAWVRQHGIRLTASTIAALQAEARRDARAAKSCCKNKSQLAKNCKACGHGGSCAHKADHQHEHQQATSSNKARIVWVSGIQAQKCQGLTTLWLSSGANLPVEIPTLWEFEWTLAGRVDVADDTHLSLSDLPAVPPPRA